MANFLETTLPKIAAPVHRLGLSASYWPGEAAVHKALDEGLNYFFLFGFDRQMVKVSREALPRVTGSGNRVVLYAPGQTTRCFDRSRLTPAVARALRNTGPAV